MANSFRYTLEVGCRKHTCPSCEKKSFVLYIDTETGKNLPDHFGRCDREDKCGFHQVPPMETRCFFVPVSSMRGISPKAVLLKQGTLEQVVPKAAIYDETSSGVYVAEYFLKDTKHQRNGQVSLTFHENEYKYFQNGTVTFSSDTEVKRKPVATVQTPVFFDFETFKATLGPTHYTKNRFIQNLFSKVPFPLAVEDVKGVVELYRLGTIPDGFRAGAVTFPFIDIKGNVRAVQVKEFDEYNHTTGTGFLHSMVKMHHVNNQKEVPPWLEDYCNQEKKVTCLFGEHLLGRFKGNPIALVEAPKTAIYGALYFGLPATQDDWLWLAVYNKSSFSFEKMKVLAGRFVYVFPDLSKNGDTYREWEGKARTYEKQLRGTRFLCSDLLERLAPGQDRQKGNDLADYLIRQDWRLFRGRRLNPESTTPQSSTPTIPPSTPVVSVASEESEAPTKTFFTPLTRPVVRRFNPVPTATWDNEIMAIESYFSTLTAAPRAVRLNYYSTVSDVPGFIESHLATVKGNNGKPHFRPYLDRLFELKAVIEATGSMSLTT